MVPTIRSFFALAVLPVIFLFLVCTDWCLNQCGAQPATAQAENQPEKSLPEIPPLPEGTPEELMNFVKELKKNNVRPSSREQMMEYMKSLASISVEAADKVLSQVKPDAPLFSEAAMMKMESLMMLGRLGDQVAAKDMAEFAATLASSPNKELAQEAQRVVLVAEAQQVFASGDIAAGEQLVKNVTSILVADPDDLKSAGLAMQIAQAFERMPGGEAVAVSALKSFGSVFSKSSNPRIKQMSESFAGTLRRLSLPGNPMEIRGTLMNGEPFDPKSLAGKVVLVDFWATWCGPCVQEIPNVLQQYEKYHDQGFEVVGISLDQDRSALEKFIVDQKVPWPILFEESEGSGWQHPLATFYGISGIPTVILIGRDGNVITLNARGEQLGQELAKLFPNAG
ncbi:MAG: TlpA disulfide reductase family protein [Pirellulales bacterium]